MSMNQLEVTAESSGVQPRADLLEVTGLYRSFGETRALDDAELVVQPGEIHALAGENGSGKTTLIKILSGVIRADRGTVLWEGRPIAPSSPAAAQRLGVSTVFQETLYAAEQNALDNIFMGMDHTFRRTHGRVEEQRIALEVLAALGAPGIDVHAPLWSLSLAERQLVTIARAVVRPWRLLILDEGTSALDASQRDQLFDYLRGERANGRSVLFTSHRMDEIESLADTVSVLRIGGTVFRSATSATTPQRILAEMAGRELSAAENPVRAQRSGTLGAAAVTAPAPGMTGESGESVETTLTVHAGEIFGLAGLEGQGQAEFAKALAGLHRYAEGRVVVHQPDGRDREVRNYGAARRLGIAYVPLDRKAEGLFFSRSTLDNFGVALLRDLSRFGFVNGRALRRRYDEYVPVVRLKANRPGDLIGTLSGGNQQKVLLARWLATGPRILVLNDPMRGVDANTKEELYALLRQLADDGLAIVLLSTELLELIALCDRIAVFHGGAVEQVLEGAEATQTEIVAAMFGHRAGDEGSER